MTLIPCHLARRLYTQYWYASRQHLCRDRSSGHLLRETPRRIWSLGTGWLQCSVLYQTDPSPEPTSFPKAAGLPALRAAFDSAAGGGGWRGPGSYSRDAPAVAYWGNDSGSWGYYAGWAAGVTDYIGEDPAEDGYASRGRHPLLTHVRRVTFTVSGHDGLAGCGEPRVAYALSASGDPPSSLAEIEALPYVAIQADGGYEVDLHEAAEGRVHLVTYHAGLVPPDAPYLCDGWDDYDAVSSWKIASVTAEYETAGEAEEAKAAEEGEKP